MELIKAKSSVCEDAPTFILKIPLKIKNLKKDISLEGIKLYLKDEFHITLLGNENGKFLLNYLKKLNLSKNEIKKFYSNIEKDINEILKKTKITPINNFYFLKKDYNREKKETRYSLIQIVKTNLIKKFFKLLKKRGVKINFDFPEPHITLYKQKENAGIGLNKKEDLEKYSVKRFNRIS